MMLSENRFFRHFKHIPIGVTGLGLGIGGLGNLYTLILKNHIDDIRLYSIIQIICTSFTIFFLMLIFLRNASHKKTFSSEIHNPLLSSFLPTICMSSMIVGGFFGAIGNMIDGKIVNHISDASFVFKAIGSIIWYLAVLFHLLFLVLFVIKVFFKHDFKQNNLYSSWFVPPVGIIVACTVVNNFNGINWIPNILAQIIWYFGFALYVIVLPLYSWQLIKHRDFKRNTLPSFAIFGAPANLSLAGFCNVFLKVNYYSEVFKTFFVSLLTILGIITTIIVYVIMFWIFKIKFNPTYASLTFPLSIGSTGVFLSSNFFLNKNEILSNILEYISYIETAIATIVIVYVLIKMLILIIFKIKENKK